MNNVEKDNIIQENDEIIKNRQNYLVDISGSEMIEKTHVLTYAIWKSKMEMSAIRLFMFYLAKINSRNIDSNKMITFNLSEYEEFYGLKKIKKDELIELLRKMMCVLTIDNDTNIKNFVMFTVADAFKDKNGKWQVTLKCSDEISNFIFFSANEFKYLKLKLFYLKDIKKTYAFILYEFLKMKEFQGNPITISVEDLKTLLDTKKIKSYQDFYRLNDLILKPAIDEINLKTDLIVKYYTNKEYRKVITIDFYITNKTKENRENWIVP